MFAAIISLLFLKLIKKTGIDIPVLENLAYQIQLKYGHLRGLGLEGIKKVYNSTVKITKPTVQSLKNNSLYIANKKPIQKIQQPLHYLSGSRKGGMKI